MRDRVKKTNLAIAFALIALSAIPLSFALGAGSDVSSEGADTGAGIKDSDAITVGMTDVIVRGFEDPATGEPITCPDGSLLRQTLRGVALDNGGPSAQTNPVCPDGSTPEAFRKVQSQWPSESDLANAKPGSIVSFDDHSFVIDKRQGEPPSP